MHVVFIDLWLLLINDTPNKDKWGFRKNGNRIDVVKDTKDCRTCFIKNSLTIFFWKGK